VAQNPRKIPSVQQSVVSGEAARLRGTRHSRLLGCNRRREALSPLRSSALENRASGSGLHALPESVLAETLDSAGLESPLHGCGSFLSGVPLPARDFREVVSNPRGRSLMNGHAVIEFEVWIFDRLWIRCRFPLTSIRTATGFRSRKSSISSPLTVVVPRIRVTDTPRRGPESGPAGIGFILQRVIEPDTVRPT